MGKSAQIDLHNSQGKVVGKVDLPAALEGKLNRDLLWQAVRIYQANQRQGHAETKTRGEVSGGGRKPWKQKHTGRARHGSIRSPIFKGGGVVFGPHPKEHRMTLSRALRRQALQHSLIDKVSSKALLAVENFDGLEPKTKSLVGVLKNLSVQEGALLVVEKQEPMLNRIARNIPRVSVLPVSDLNCCNVLAAPRLVVTSKAVKQLEKRLS